MTIYTESVRAFLRPIVPYLDDESVSEIMINGPEDVWVERCGRLVKTDARFSEEGLLGAARNVAQFVGRPLSPDKPQLDARLPDGSRIHVVLPPIARRGVTIAVRKFPKERLTLNALLGLKSLTAPMSRLTDAAIQMKLNIIVSGGTGSGKTTLLNVISSLIPADERVVTIEDSAELQLKGPHVVSLESRMADKSGHGGIDLGDLLLSALRLRPDRIVVGEVRGPESFHLIQALNTGHGGSLSTCHANTPMDTLRRLEALCLMSAVDLPMVAVRAQIASAINLVICCARLPDGSRKVTAISAVLPLTTGGEYRTQDLFVYVPVHRERDGTVIGYHAPTGIVPHFAAGARAFGFADLDEQFFDPATYDLPVPPAVRAEEVSAVRWAPSLKHRERGLPDPEWLSEKRSDWEGQLRTSAQATQNEPTEPPNKVVARPRSIGQTGQFLVGAANPSAAPAQSLDIDVEPPTSGAVRSSPRPEAKVELAPDLVAELDSLGVPLEITPANPAAVRARTEKARP